MKLKCIIIDDEPLAVALIENYVEKTPFLELRGKYNSAINAIEQLNNEQIDLLFLDIQMPELSGMEFSRMLKNEIRIIFTTAFEQYALDSYKVNALDYLLKPISYSDFLKSANKALKWYEMLQKPMDGGTKNEKERIFIKTEYKLVQIDLGKILYIEGQKDYIHLYIEGEEKPVVSLMSMKAIEEILPQNSFVRVHRSFIVQADKIKVIERNRIVFGKSYIPISDNYRDAFYLFLENRSIVTSCKK